jgi:hypothetical protein
MRAVIWVPGEPLGQFDAERAAEIRGEYTGPTVAVLDENDGVAVVQPMDPDTGENWPSEEAALAWAARYMRPPEPDQPDDVSN